MSRLTKVVFALLLVVCFISLSINVRHYKQSKGTSEYHIDTTRVVVIDTLCYYKPVPKDSVVVRYITIYLPTNDKQADTAVELPVDASKDSLAITIPITQKRYETPDYTAFVSGYLPSLDSLFLTRKTEEVTITKTLQKRPLEFALTAGAMHLGDFGVYAGAEITKSIGRGLSLSIATGAGAQCGRPVTPYANVQLKYNPF